MRSFNSYYTKGLFVHVAKSSFLQHHQDETEGNYDAGSAREKSEDGVCCAEGEPK